MYRYLAPCIVAALLASSVQASVFIYNGHTYGITPTQTWVDAEAHAVSLGGHLVTINDADENEFIRTTFLNISGEQEDFWIGFYCQTPPSSNPANYVWSSGEPVTYSNWRRYQPDLSNDNYTAINYVKKDSGYWDNYPGSWTRRGIYEITSTAIIGDLNADGFVGLDDLDIVLNNWNQNIPPANPQADPSGDGYVGLDDLDIVLNNWNTGTPPGDTANIPEPGALALLAGSLIGITSRRR